RISNLSRIDFFRCAVNVVLSFVQMGPRLLMMFLTNDCLVPSNQYSLKQLLEVCARSKPNDYCKKFVCVLRRTLKMIGRFIGLWDSLIIVGLIIPFIH